MQEHGESLHVIDPAAYSLVFSGVALGPSAVMAASVTGRFHIWSHDGTEYRAVPAPEDATGRGG